MSSWPGTVLVYDPDQWHMDRVEAYADHLYYTGQLPEIGNVTYGAVKDALNTLPDDDPQVLMSALYSDAGQPL